MCVCACIVRGGVGGGGGGGGYWSCSLISQRKREGVPGCQYVVVSLSDATNNVCMCYSKDYLTSLLAQEVWGGAREWLDRL